MKLNISAKSGELQHNNTAHEVDMRKIKNSDRVTVVAMMKQRLFGGQKVEAKAS